MPGSLGAGWGKEIVELEPTGPITDAPAPIAVRCYVHLRNGQDVIIPTAWAMAWTSLAVLVFWRDPRSGTTTTIWLPAARVRHRDSPVRE